MERGQHTRERLKADKMKKILIPGLCVLSLGAAFVGGVLWEYTAERAEIADIQAAAAESCAKRVKLAERVCKY